jgi:hypothetical protein
MAIPVVAKKQNRRGLQARDDDTVLVQRGRFPTPA